jgi:hypothetical protein
VQRHCRHPKPPSRGSWGTGPARATAATAAS